MRIELENDDEAVSADQRADLVARVFWTLCRYGDRVGLVRVRLRRLEGPASEGGNGVVSHCGIAVDLVPEGRVLARSRAADSQHAVDQAAERIGHAVGERLSPPVPFAVALPAAQAQRELAARRAG